MNFDFGVNQTLIEDQYRRYLDNPESVGEEWRTFFDSYKEGGHAVTVPAGAIHDGSSSGEPAAFATSSYSELAWNVMRMISQYRSRGHYYAQIDPLGLSNELPDALNRSEEHTSELQSRGHLVCRLLLEKKNSE